MSDFDICEPGMPQWPSYAAAVYFGLGRYHEELPAKIGQKPVSKRPCRGGYIKNGRQRPTKELSFPDHCIFTYYFQGTTLAEHIAGVFVAGGGEEIRDQLKIYGVDMSDRGDGDCYVRANDAKGRAAKTEFVMPIPQLHYNNSRTGAVIGRPGSGKYIPSQ